MTHWSIAPVVDWLMHKGRHLPAEPRRAHRRGHAVIRRRLEQPGCPLDFPVLEEVKAEWPGLGRFDLPGIEAPMEVLALP